MSLLDLKPKEMELVLRLYLNRIDTKPLYWWYYNNGHGTQIKARHKGETKTVTCGDLLEFLYPDVRFIFNQDKILVLMQK